MGKGSKPRPFSVSLDEFDANWDMIFALNRKAQSHQDDIPPREIRFYKDSMNKEYETIFDSEVNNHDKLNDDIV